MKRGLYSRLAWLGMRKNGRLYLPYLVAGAVMTMIWYILVSLGYSEKVGRMHGGSTLATVLVLGTWVIAFFSLIFLFYTNSFLIRSRKRELGLYNVLGMSKGHISRILLWETLICFGVVFGIGTGLGILLSKAAELGLVRIVGDTADYSFRVDVKRLPLGAALYGGIYFLIFLNSLRQIHLTRPVELLRSEAAGEKPPRANWVAAVLGIAVLGAAYWIAVFTADPIAALDRFFIAVLMVIAATYLLFIAGSVALCRLLQKNPRYYYKAAHFVSVSSMRYRMKRSGAGLASICILSTMVLVMLSAAVSMYAGSVRSAENRYPYDLEAVTSLPVSLVLSSAPEELEEKALSQLRETLDAGLGDAQVTQRVELVYVYLNAPIRDGVLTLHETADPLPGTNVALSGAAVQIVELADYNRQTGAQETLDAGEVLLIASRSYGEAYMIGWNGGTWRVREADTDRLPIFEDALSEWQFILAVPSLRESMEQAQTAGAFERGGAAVNWRLAVNTDEPHDRQIAIRNAMAKPFLAQVNALAEAYGEECSAVVTSKAGALDDYLGLNGGLLFLAILLGAVFLFAAGLIMYYRQITEGYEDQKRFGIMRQVGMTRRDIRRSVNSQMLTVFFMPLLAAGLHLAFASPMLIKILRLMALDDVRLMLTVTAVSFLAFAGAYVLLYKWTANAYYRIVSGND